MSIEGGGAVTGVRLLAEGPVARVHVGRVAGAEVAVKVFPAGFDRATAAALDRERKALDTVRAERAILPIDGVADLDGRSGVWMELCRGSLAGLLAQGGQGGTPLSVPDVLAVGWTIATALASAQAVGVVHGGVTPHNVLYRLSGEPVLADFGTALRRRFPRDPKLAVEYAAPETLRDDTLSAASDLYGLGAVLYAALTGAPPFPHVAGQRTGDRILRVLREPVAPITAAGVPAELSEVLCRLLAKDPADRPRDAAGVAESFERLYRTAAGQPAVEFDDFAAAVPPAPVVFPAPVPPAGPPVLPVPPAVPSAVSAVPVPSGVASGGGRTLVRTFDGSAPSQPERRSRIGRRLAILVGLGVAVVGLTAVPVIIALNAPSRQPAAPAAVNSAPPAQPPSSADPAPKVNLVLAPPVDLGTTVQLNWSADGELDFAVVVAGERIGTTVQVVNRQHTASVPVDPARKYCFQIRATDGTHIYTSDPAPLRGAHCTR
ncbi:protein kinase [Amycolatopsis cynarae]|uniref:non-specific serine/threonine protein kinase n=1 Tax=Amycolatopsis cynarae TaxID=2995223 RepID=A0ABY7B7J8_9PSEU|nr:protein kinase [Amycolatopsis sp. HUAS 11-8]WAL68106.1 protein kinase [Amycolatopsis sp. HUAS 11-8]